MGAVESTLLLIHSSCPLILCAAWLEGSLCSFCHVSCDPATQMRDLKEFLASGYEVTAVQPFDLFPQTRHLECVITLVIP